MASLVDLERAAKDFQERIASPGQVDWTSRHDVLLAQVAREFGVDENELFEWLVGEGLIDEPPNCPSSLSPEEFEDLKRQLGLKI